MILTSQSKTSKVVSIEKHLPTSNKMSQIRGTANYHLGPDQRMFGGGPSAAASDPSPLDAIREQTNKIEDLLDTFAEPIKP